MPTSTELRDYISLISGDITAEELTVPEFEMLIRKSLITYNSYMPDTVEFITVIRGSLITMANVGYQFSAPYPTSATATAQFTGLNWWPDISSANYTYSSTTGMLSVPITGTYIVRYTRELSLDTLGELTHPLFYKLLEAHYKIVVGGRRKKFLLMDNQITNDGDMLVGEGQAMLDQLKEELSDNMPIWMALGTR